MVTPATVAAAVSVMGAPLTIVMVSVVCGVVLPQLVQLVDEAKLPPEPVEAQLFAASAILTPIEKHPATITKNMNIFETRWIIVSSLDVDI